MLTKEEFTQAIAIAFYYSLTQQYIIEQAASNKMKFITEDIKIKHTNINQKQKVFKKVIKKPS